MIDPRGPRRTITAVEYGSLPDRIGVGDAWLLTLDCGHISYGAPHFSYTVGKPSHCLECRSNR